MSVIFFSVLAFVVVALVLPFVRRWALAGGFVDRPGGRKIHKDETPPIGGLVIFPVFILLSVGYFLLTGGLEPQILWLNAALLLLVVTGAVDDRFGVAPRIKFVVQFVAAFILVIPGGAYMTNLGDLFGLGDFWLGFMTLPFAVIATVLLINAVNLMDGLDGLVGGKGIIILFWLLVSCLLSDAGAGFVPPLMILIAGLAGFLIYNLRTPWHKKASVFLGDAGALALGAALAWFCLSIAKQGHGAVIAPISVAWLLALPIYDICGQFARRMLQGRHPFDADAHHFHHHFVNVGVPVARATAFILALTFVCGVIGVGGVWIGVPLPVLTIGWIAGLFVHIYLSLRPQRMRRLIRFFFRRACKNV